MSRRKYAPESTGELTRGITVESSPLKLSISDLSRGGVLRPGADGTLFLTNAAGAVASVFFKTGDDTLELRFSVAGPSQSGSLEIVETITLAWTPCNYGGSRPWFRCPGITRPCGRRVGVLYATGAHFLRARLGDYGDLLDPLPKRPPGMRRKTYLAICAEITAATELALGALAEQMIALERRVEPLLERLERLDGCR